MLKARRHLAEAPTDCFAELRSLDWLLRWGLGHAAGCVQLDWLGRKAPWSTEAFGEGFLTR